MHEHPEHVITVREVTKRFTDHIAVHDLSLAVPAGSIYGLLGPNGAGKTTTIRMMLSIIVPDSGIIQLFGEDTSGRDVSHRIGYLPEERGLYRKMRVRAAVREMRRSAGSSNLGCWIGLAKRSMRFRRECSKKCNSSARCSIIRSC
jgi:ABC-2 type transport system ATP-binding protein